MKTICLIYFFVNALQDISLEVIEGEIVGIVGESGSGKTTLAKILSGILKPDSGEIIYNRKVTNDISSETNIQLLFQNSIELINPLRNVEDILSEILKKYSISTKDKINELLNIVGLEPEILTKTQLKNSEAKLVEGANKRLYN